MISGVPSKSSPDFACWQVCPRKACVGSVGPAVYLLPDLFNNFGLQFRLALDFGDRRLTPLPEFTDDCFFCYTCVQNCPEEALTTEKAHLDGYLRKRSAEVDETPGTRYFA